MCHQIAQAAAADIAKAKDSHEFPDLDQLAGLKHGKNLSTAVDRHLASQSKLPMPMEIDMPYKKGNSKSLITLPHEIFAALYSNTSAWVQCINPCTEKLEEFWSSFSSHPCMDGHPAKRFANWTRTFIPIMLHGDEVPVSGIGNIWCHSALAFSWASLIAHCLGGAVDDISIYIWTLRIIQVASWRSIT